MPSQVRTDCARGCYVDALCWSVHLGAGIWGVFARPIFDQGFGIIYHMVRVQALFILVFMTLKNAVSWKYFAWNFAGLLSIIAWTGFFCLVLLSILKVRPNMPGLYVPDLTYLLQRFDKLRLSADIESKGIDAAAHGDRAYQLFSTNLMSHPPRKDSDARIPPMTLHQDNRSHIVDLGSVPESGPSHAAPPVARATRRRSASEAVVPIVRGNDLPLPQAPRTSTRDLTGPPLPTLKPNHIETPPMSPVNKGLEPIEEAPAAAKGQVMVLVSERLSHVGDTEGEAGGIQVEQPVSLSRRRSHGGGPPSVRRQSSRPIAITGDAAAPNSSNPSSLPAHAPDSPKMEQPAVNIPVSHNTADV